MIKDDAENCHKCNDDCLLCISHIYANKMNE